MSDVSTVPPDEYALGSRAGFPALAQHGLTLLDGPGGTQIPASVARAISAALTSPVSNVGGAYASALVAERIVDEARRAMSDLLGGPADGLVMGPNMTTLTYRFAHALSREWGEGDEVVVSRLDHDANIRPWVQAAGRRGATVRWADFDPATGVLAPEVYDALITDKTRLVAVTAASNVLGTRPDVATISRKAHAVGARVYVDGVHLTPHAPVDVHELGADFYACSSYKFCGPHLGFVMSEPALLRSLQQDRLLPAPGDAPHLFEWGTAPFELLAGVPATVDMLASFSTLTDPAASRRQHLLDGLAELETQEDRLSALLRARLAEIPAARTYGAAPVRTPTVAFTIDGYSNLEVATRLGEDGICINHGNHYAYELMCHIGLDPTEGVLRAGIAPYNTVDDVLRLTDGLARLSTR